MSPFRSKWWIKLILVVKSLIFTVQHGPTPLTLFLSFFGSTSLKVWGKHKTILKKLTWKHSRLLTGKWEQSKSNVQHWTSNPASVITHKYKELIHLNTQDWAPVCGSCHVACCIEYSGRDEHHCSTNHVLCSEWPHAKYVTKAWHTMYDTLCTTMVQICICSFTFWIWKIIAMFYHLSPKKWKPERAQPASG